MTKKYLENAYGHAHGEAARKFYDEWAATYDAETSDNGYITPVRCAAALADLTEDQQRPILDLGCGTGLSGAALKSAGFAAIDGWDPSSEMLRQAEKRHVYRVLRQIEPEASLDAPANAYAAVNAAGVLSPGLAPPEAFDQILAFLPKGGHISFSLNDHAIEDGAHERRMTEIVDAGAAILRFKEYGDHLPGREMKSWVYVLEKT
ncbi:MAG: class I SAM-dependent methyltransferase [Pseudomonadota bacterium]